MSTFKREDRYIVIKKKGRTVREIDNLLNYLQSNMIPTTECVVVEPDWPNYEHVWNTVQQVEEGTFREPVGPIYLFHVKYLNTSLSNPDPRHHGKSAKVYARTAVEALEKLSKAVEKPNTTSQRLVMDIRGVEEVL